MTCCHDALRKITINNKVINRSTTGNVPSRLQRWINTRAAFDSMYQVVMNILVPN